jgi:hypothetical protein
MPLTLAGTPAINGLAVPTDTLSSGLVLITSQTFSAASTVSVNNCFTSTYENYRLQVSVSSHSATGSFYIRFRAAGTDTSTSTYTWGNGRAGRTSLSDGGGSSSATSFSFGYNTTGTPCHFSFDVFRGNTSASAGLAGNNYSTDAGPIAAFFGGICTQATAHDGLTIYPASGTMTGTIRVYGYRNS